MVTLGAVDVVHGFAGTAAVFLCFLESRGCFTPRRAPAILVLSQIVEVSEETALTVPGAAFGDAFGDAFGALGAATSCILWGLGYQRKATAKGSQAQASQHNSRVHK